MKALFKRYENIILLLVLFIGASVLMASNVKENPSPNILERAVLVVGSPLQKGISTTIRKVVDVWTHYVYLVHTVEHNERLRTQLMEKAFQNRLLLEELKKYRRVESLLSYHPIGKSKFLVASVVGWDSTNLAQTLVIDRGVGHGVKEGMVVITHQGLIGRVVTASKNSSRVLMLTDARSAADAYLQESRVRCIVVGQNKNTLTIRYLSTDAEVKVGDVLISSGLGGVFPKGLPIGMVSSVETEGNKLFLKARAIPSADLEHLEEVMVMTGPSELSKTSEEKTQTGN